MRVLHVNIGYPPLIGGAELYLRQVARRMVARGHQVAVYASDAAVIEHLWAMGKEHLPAGVAEIEGVTVRRFAVRHLPLLPYSYLALRRLLVECSCLGLGTEGWLWRIARYAPWLPGLERAFVSAESAGMPWRPELLHVWNIPFESLWEPAWRYARRRGIPCIATPLLHLGEEGSAAVRRFYTMRHQMSVLRDCDAVIALTQLEADYLVSAGVLAARVHVVGGGVDIAAMQAGDARRFRARYALDRPFVLFIGAYNVEKGAIALVEAVAALGREGRDLDLVMIGQPMARFMDYYRRLSADVQARCHLLGPLGDEDKADALAACEMLALPSRTESFGLVYLEAWAAGKPVIGARAGAVPAVVREGVDGVLVPFGDAAALARAIAALLDDPAMAQRLGLMGKARVSQAYTWDQVVTAIERVYEKAVACGAG